MKSVFNFGAGPSMLPKEVLLQIHAELLDWQKLGMSVMEVSHRSKEFMHCAAEAEKNLRELLHIPENYDVLFCQGGARAQFTLLPLNLLSENDKIDYILSGFWSTCAANEASHVCHVNPVDIIQKDQKGIISLTEMKNWSLSKEAKYLHYCPNETIEGRAIFGDPEFKDKIVFADLSSTILSQPIDVSKYGVIYAGAQKNIGPSGLTIVIVRKDLLPKTKRSGLSSVFDYQKLAENDSMINTPPTFAWYVAGLVFKWLKAQGGVQAIASQNAKKANLLYETIDKSAFYQNNVAKQNRSQMNVIFNLNNPELEAMFLNEANKAGFIGLKGHRALGGIRASIYNAMPLEGVVALTEFMTSFEQRHG